MILIHKSSVKDKQKYVHGKIVNMRGVHLAMCGIRTQNVMIEYTKYILG
jgi:hypothetical protein